MAIPYWLFHIGPVLLCLCKTCGGRTDTLPLTMFMAAAQVKFISTPILVPSGPQKLICLQPLKASRDASLYLESSFFMWYWFRA